MPDGTELAPQNYLVLCNDREHFRKIFSDVFNYLGDFDFGLSGSGESVRLIDNFGNVADSLTYDDRLPWPESPDGEGSTLSLINPCLDNALPENWGSSKSHGTPGKVNDTYRAVDEETGKIIEAFVLNQNYPNPFNSMTSIPFILPVDSFVTIEVYSILGQKVMTLTRKKYPAGKHTISFDIRHISSGVYLYTIKAGKYSKTKKMVVMK